MNYIILIIVGVAGIILGTYFGRKRMTTRCDLVVIKGTRGFLNFDYHGKYHRTSFGFLEKEFADLVAQHVFDVAEIDRVHFGG